MAITMFSFGALFAPLHGLLSRLAAAPGTPAAPARRGDGRPAVVRTRGWSPRPAGAQQCRPAGARPLRVFRARGDAPAAPLRMAISGRMADVCAELERLAALESAAR